MDTSKIPTDPGCYLFKDSNGMIIYIGKAVSLKKRVSSYFNRDIVDPKTKALVANIEAVEYIVTDNEKEALILENNLIKKHQPHYNIDLKDSKKYAYILLTDEPYPRLLLARQKTGRGTYFGPFTSAVKRDILLKFANNTFRLRTCRLRSKRACLRYQMGLCSGACIGKVSEDEYGLQVEDAKKVLTGKAIELVKELHQRMTQASVRQEYEDAGKIRDQIAAIESLSEQQKMDRSKSYDQDVINYILHDGKVHIAVFNIYKGTLSEKQEFEFVPTEDFLVEFLLQFYEEQIPKEIILPEHVSHAMAEYLEEKRGSKVIITVPERGEKLDLLLLAKKNLEKEHLENEQALYDLKDKLRLKVLPRRIECFDISHIQGSDPVGSMITFFDCIPDKDNYRRFRIRTIEGIDDFAMIAEVVRRRYRRQLDERKELPDLIVIDGGKGQLLSALESLKSLGLSIPAIGLAKKNEEVYFPGRSLPHRFDRSSAGLKLLQRIRDEAHRFAVKYHTLLRRKRTIR